MSAPCQLRPGWRGKSERLAAASRSGIVSAESAAWCPVRVATPAGPSVSEGQSGVGSADSGVAESHGVRRDVGCDTGRDVLALPVVTLGCDVRA